MFNIPYKPKIDDFEATETHSMIIEGGNDALRLDVNVDRFGKPIKVGVSSVDNWITKKDNSGHKNDEGIVILIQSLHFIEF